MQFKFLHTSDVHLGAKFVSLGVKADLYRDLIHNSFRKTIDAALDEQVNLVLISGDLFDDANPSNSNVSFVHDELSRLDKAGIKVFIIAGNHDLWADGSIYKSEFLSDLASIKVFSDSVETIRLDEFDLSITSYSVSSKKTQESALGKIKPDQSSKTNIALVHASFVIDESKQTNNPITKQEIESSGFDYIALGDWHGFLDVSSGKTKAVYPGSPEPITLDQKNAGSVIIVEVNDGELKLSQKRVGVINILEKEIELTANDNLNSINLVLKEYYGEFNILNLILKGQVPINNLDLDELQKLVDKHLFKLIIKDNTKLDLDDELIKEISKDPVVDLYIKKLNELSIEEKYSQVKDNALKIGLKSFYDSNKK